VAGTWQVGTCHVEIHLSHNSDKVCLSVRFRTWQVLPATFFMFRIKDLSAFCADVAGKITTLPSELLSP